MSKVRTFSPSDTSRIWELLNEVGAAVNPVTQDTGQVAGALNGGAATWGGSAVLHRVGSIVYAQGYLTVTAGGPFVGQNREGTGFLNVPEGYKPVYRNYPISLGQAWTSGGAATLRWLNDFSRVSVVGVQSGGTWVAGNFIAFSASWITNEAFPA